MGAGIAHALLLAGSEVVLTERNDDAAQGARSRGRRRRHHILGAGADILLFLDAEPSAVGGLSILANVARFHQGLLAVTGEPGGLTRAERFALADPKPATGLAINEDWLPRATDLSELEEWVDAVRG
jgi:NAD(P)-dependent dehydrogenase (short-subunit alcohol dehydrogenase family)